MQGLQEVNSQVSSFSAELNDQKKVDTAAGQHHIIREESVADLTYVDVSKRLYSKVKRVLDFTLAFLGLSVALIPMAVIAVVIFLDDPGNVIFSQYRVGRGGRVFKLFKFRSMKKSAPKYMATADLDNPQRHCTRVGRLLRKLSLDELPQLLNVLIGDMSLIGPRPLIEDEQQMHTMRTRFGVYTTRPGITGLAQINGRDLVTAEEKIRWDVQYMQNFGFKSDLKILLTTVPKVLSREGVKCEGKKQDGTE